MRDFWNAPKSVQSTACEKVGDAVDVATLSGASMKRYVNSTMTASPANLKTKTSSPVERQVVNIHLGVMTKYNKIYTLSNQFGDHVGDSMNIQ